MNVPPKVFVHASFFIALMSAKDLARRRAIAWNDYLRSNRAQFITTEAVLWEWLNFFADPSMRDKCVQGNQFLHQDPRMEIVEFESVQCRRAVELYASRPDKGWGVTDCLSFVVMQERGLTSALTTDHHFAQAAFTLLMLTDPPT